MANPIGKRDWWRAHEASALLVLVAVAVVLRAVLAVESPTPYGYVYDFYHEAIQKAYAVGRLPTAEDCWTCYQPPLLTLVGLPIYAIVKPIVNGPGGLADPALRIVALLSFLAAGVAAYYSYRVLRFFRLRGRELVVGTGLVLAFPCLFISSYGIEADILLTALLTAFLYYALEFFGRPGRSRPIDAVRLGLIAGLACETKFSGLTAPVTLAVTTVAYLFTTSHRRRLLSRVAVAFGVAVLVGSWVFVSNYVRYGRPLVANGSAQQGFTVRDRPSYRHLYDFTSLRMTDLSRLVYGQVGPAHLTDLPFYRSVWTTLHAMAWGDMTMFSDPSRHGFYRQPYPRKRLNPDVALAVLLLGLVPDGLAVIGLVVSVRRKIVWPLTVMWLVTWAVYIFWFTAQESWALKTKYILFLLPAYVVYAILGWRWVRHWSEPAGEAVFVALVLLLAGANAYLLDFAWH